MVIKDKGFMKLNINNNRWRLGACPRCRGALYSNYGEDFTCFQCGYVEYKFSIRGGYNGQKSKKGR